MRTLVVFAMFALVMAALPGCRKHTATIVRNDQTVVEGVIKSGDTTTLTVEERGTEQDVVIQRADISDIDHPGNVQAIVGGVLVVVGAVPFGFGVAGLADDTTPTAAVAALVIGTPIFGAGLGALIKGLVVWTGSKDAAAPPPVDAATWVVTPVPLTDGVDVGTGIGLTVVF